MPYKIDNFEHFPHTIPDATETAAGVMSIADKIKLDSLTPGGGTIAHSPSIAALPSPVANDSTLRIADLEQALCVAMFGVWVVIVTTP